MGEDGKAAQLEIAQELADLANERKGVHFAGISRRVQV